MDFQALDRRALEAADAVVARVRADQLDRPTPCAGWTLTELLTHLLDENYYFAAGAGAGVPDSYSDQDAIRRDPYGEFVSSAKLVNEAFAAEGVLDREMPVRDFGSFPAPFAIGVHFVEVVVHTWDIARTVGLPDGLDQDLTDAALEYASSWPDVPQLRGPEAPFAEKVEVAEDAPVSDRLVALLGRSPSWSAGS